MKFNNTPLVVIVGPTGSGKTGLSIELAKEYNGEIVSADSRAIYRTLDIGTAKPSAGEMQGVPHWGIDLINPDENYSVAEFKKYADLKIREIRERGKIPFLVGGSGLYVDAVIFDYKFDNSDASLDRQGFESMSLEELYEYCNKNNIELPENYKNKRHVINTICKRGIKSNRKDNVDKNTIIVGIDIDKDKLKDRLSGRVREMLSKGLIKEAEKFYIDWPNAKESSTGNAYRLAKEYMEKGFSEDEFVERFVTLDKKLVKKQKTWFKRNKEIVWLDLDNAYTYIDELLAKHRSV
jgi:tRNA dimethylallyltransferase